MNARGPEDGLHLLDDADQVGGIGQVAVVEVQVAVLHVGVLVEVVDAVGVEQRGAALDAVDDVAFLEQEFGEIGAVLAGDASDQCNFLGHWNSPEVLFNRDERDEEDGKLLPRRFTNIKLSSASDNPWIFLKATTFQIFATGMKSPSFL